MKSDREFLQGVYKKAEELKLSTQTVIEKESLFEKQRNSIFMIKPVRFRLVMVAVVFVFMITSGVFLNSFITEKEIEKPQTFGLTPRGIQVIEDEQQIWDRVTDVVEVRTSRNEDSLEIVQVYKGHIKEEAILNKVKDSVTHLDKGQTSIILLQESHEDVTVLDVYYSVKDSKGYRNLTNEELTKEDLENHLME